MEVIKDYIKKHKVSADFLSKETGYTRVSISYYLNGKRKPSEKFEKLLMMALTKFAYKNILELQEALEGTKWSSLFLSYASRQ